MQRLKLKAKRRLRRRHHTRSSMSGTQAKPRMAVFRSARHIYAQLIDDEAGRTLVTASTQSKSLKPALKKTGNKQAAELVGREIAKIAVGVGITHVAFDRGGFKYHGRVKALADGARAGGLKF